MPTIEELIAQALAGGVTAAEGQAILNSGISLGDLSAMSGVPLSEINSFIGANNLTVPNPTVDNSGGGNAGGTTAATTTPTSTNAPRPVPTPGQPTDGLTLPPIENLGNTFAGNFGNNPGALGFSDLNPIVVGAENTQQTAIPEFLKPFLASAVDASQGAQTSLTQLLARDNALTSPFNNLQEISQQGVLDVAQGAGGFIPQAQSVLSEIADGTDIFDTFNQGKDLLTGSSGRSALEQTASGDFLFGNPGFDAAVQASIAQAMPHIGSNIALQGGAGALSGSAKDAALVEAATNAFAREFGNERNRQIGAANSLVGADQFAGSTLAGIANADRSRQFSAATQLPQVGLLGSNLIGRVGDTRQQQEERTKLGQVQSMQQLLSGAFGQVNPNALFGNINSVQTNSNTAGGLLGGALTGAQLGGMFGPAGTAIGAIGGGLLGAFG